MKRTKKTRFVKFLKCILWIGLAGILTLTAINLTVVLDGKQAICSEEKVAEQIAEGVKYDCIMVLGCGVYADGSPTPMLKDRLDKAIALYHSGYAPKLLLSGDHGTVGYNEVAGMYRYCQEQGIPEDDIFLDHAGFTTYESVYRAQAIFGVQQIIIVTQPYHLYRAMWYARRLGLSGCGVAAEKYPYSGELFRQGREVLSRVKALVYGIVKPLPTYLGETVDITGSGTVTRDFTE